MLLTLMCGLSFAGKSTVAATIVEHFDVDLLSLDAINAERGLEGGKGIPVEEWATTNAIAHERARIALRAGRSVVIDDTGSPRFIRDAWRETAVAGGASFAIVWVRIDASTQRQRVEANRDCRMRMDVTDEVLKAHRAGFDEPTADERPILVDGGSAIDVEVLLRRLRDADDRGVRAT
jgi:predicted kinase